LEHIQLTYHSEKIHHQIIEFSKNYGHEVAMLAGIDHSTGDAVIIMDSDGQHPPSIIANMLVAYENGNDIVLMKRTNLIKNNFFKTCFLAISYFILNKILDINLESNSPDFSLISNQVAKILSLHFREKNRLIRGHIQTIGFNKTTLNFIVPDRKFGASSNNFFTLFKLAINAIFLFSTKPISLIIFSPIFILTGVIAHQFNFFQLNLMQLTSILILSFSCMLSIAAIYLKKILVEIRNRPLYIIKQHIV
ncbi:MAG: hypothetical protein RIQ33_163, partial [Bacteroidota bacterium]